MYNLAVLTATKQFSLSHFVQVMPRSATLGCTAMRASPAFMAWANALAQAFRACWISSRTMTASSSTSRSTSALTISVSVLIFSSIRFLVRLAVAGTKARSRSQDQGAGLSVSGGGRIGLSFLEFSLDAGFD